MAYELNIDGLENNYIKQIGTNNGKIVIILQNNTTVIVNQHEIEILAATYKELVSENKTPKCQSCGPTGWHPTTGGNS